MPAKAATRKAASKASNRGSAQTKSAPNKSAAKKSVSAKSASAKSSAGKSTAAQSASKGQSAEPLTDHEAIQSWAEERGAKPACVKRTGGKGDTGMIRLDFPGYSGEGSLQEISWDEWFGKFDQNKLALIVQQTTADGQRSNFNKLVQRTSAARRSRGGAR